MTSLSVNGSGTRLAAGTQDGVTIFDISEGNLSCIFFYYFLLLYIYFFC